MTIDPWRGACRSFLAVLIVLATVAVPGVADAAGRTVPLRLIGINDFHGNLESTGLTLEFADPHAGPNAKPLKVPLGGAAANAGLVETLRDGAPHSLMLSAGDLIGASPLVSTLFRHESTIEVMNAIGLELDAVGNHEFDAGFGELQRVAAGGCAVNAPGAVLLSCRLHTYRGANFPLLSANVLGGDGRPVLAPYVIKRYGGVRVGIIGAVTKTAPSIVSPSGIVGLRFIDEADGVNRAARQLRARGVRAIVAVFHEGGELGTSGQRGDWNDVTCPDRHGPIFDIAARLVPEISVVFSAHTHQGYRCLIDGRTIISGTSYGRGMSVVDVQLDRRSGRMLPALTRSINLPVVNGATDPQMREALAAELPPPYADILRRTRPDPRIAAMVASYAAVVAPTVERQVGSVGGSFSRSREVDSPAGRLIADAQLEATRATDRGGARIAFMNPGGIRSDLECRGSAEPPCPATFGQVFSMQPFGNALVVMSLSGAQLKSLLESQQKGAETTFLQPSAGFTYTWQSRPPSGQPHASDLRLNGEPIEDDRAYRVTVNSFLAEGGDGFVTLLRGTDRVGGGGDVEAMLDYLRPPAVRTPIREPRVRVLP